ncbi:hypothetical protein ACLB2K_069338 [Fragaria x ananassa]
MKVLALKLVLVYSVFIAMFIFSCSSMRLSHSLTTGLDGNETDRLALLAIKANIQHDPNLVTSSWNESIHFCLWHGITCSRKHHQRVTMLNLNSQGLAGSIPPHIGNLSYLRYLFLYNNSFTHQIPPEIGRLHRLQQLSLVNNSFTGHIPANISNCFNLTFLTLANNKLEGEIPSELGFLSKLQILALQDNNLTGEIPPSFGNLSSLEVLSAVSDNLVGSIPSSFGRLKKLTFLSFGINMLSGTIPPSFYNMSAIVTCDFGDNRIQASLPSDFSDAFPNLEVFRFDSNELTGGIPLSISNATSLVLFDVGDNSLTGQVPSMGKLSNLMVFSIADNYLGSGKQDELRFISQLINATQLNWLILGYNNFGGTLPTSISNLSTNLEILWVSQNKLHGSIPTGLGNLVNLQSLFMGENSFTGSIPNIGKLSKLVEWHNNTQLLNGLISLSISLNLSNNQFSGSLPPEIGKLKNLGALDISDNLLSGQLTSSLGSCGSLEILHLQGNFFNGVIPSSFNNLRALRDLDLSRNNLSGEVPQFFERFGNLENLNLSFNQFWGAVPTGGVFKNASVTSVAGNTRLCGGIGNLQLSMCKSNVSKGGGLSRIMKLMISLASGFTLLGLVVVLSLFLRRKKKKVSELSTLGNSVLQVSYAAILKATDEFSSSNLIGVGAFGSVYKGVLPGDSVTVAVKVFNMLHRGASKSFISECEALRNIRHRNLVKIVTACSSTDFSGNDFKALIYEFMDNGSLEDWLHPSTGNEEVTVAPKSLSLVQRLDIAIDVASALDYLHNNCETPIVHCDLKPSNVLLDSDMTGHVSDFGLSRFLGETTTNVSGNQSSSIGIRGSVGYAAPEYGMGSEVSAYGDVYSFGILLLEMFTGKRPTDHFFSDGMNLHNYVKMALPERVPEISESIILVESTTNVTDETRSQLTAAKAQKIKECLTLIFGIGIVCSSDSPTNRKDISDVLVELQNIRNNLLG